MTKCGWHVSESNPKTRVPLTRNHDAQTIARPQTKTENRSLHPFLLLDGEHIMPLIQMLTKLKNRDKQCYVAVVDEMKEKLEEIFGTLITDETSNWERYRYSSPLRSKSINLHQSAPDTLWISYTAPKTSLFITSIPILKTTPYQKFSCSSSVFLRHLELDNLGYLKYLCYLLKSNKQV